MCVKRERKKESGEECLFIYSLNTLWLLCSPIDAELKLILSAILKSMPVE